MKKALLISAALYSCLTFAFADRGGRVESVMFLPPDFYVGDVVELRAVIVPDDGTVLSIPKELPNPFWIKMNSLSMKELSGGGYEVRLIFSSYSPGTRTLPPLVLGDMVIDRIKIHTESILSDGNLQLSEIRDPMLLPGTVFILTLLVLLILGGPLLVIFSVGFIKRTMDRLIAKFTLTLPFRRFNKLIKDLNAEFFSRSDRDFYFSLSEGLRQYLCDKTGEDFITVTLEEIGNLMPKYLSNFEDQKQMIKLLHYADLIKFSGGGSILEKKRRDLDDAFALIRSIESGDARSKKEAAGADV